MSLLDNRVATYYVVLREGEALKTLKTRLARYMADKAAGAVKAPLQYGTFGQ